MRNDEELKQIAIDLFSGKIFTDRHLNSPEELAHHFMPLVFMKETNLKKLSKKVDFIYEYMDKAMPMGCNGKPIFMSLQYLTKPETKKMLLYHEKLKTAVKKL